MVYGSTPFEEIIFAMMMYVEDTDVSMLKNYKMVCLSDILSSACDNCLYDSYDEYYEDIDEKLNENNSNFFEELQAYQDEKFTCYGVMDDDDLADYDELLK